MSAIQHQTWNAALYDRRHAFVFQHGADLLALLQPKPGERILDLGCGTGHLTSQIATAGAAVHGIDASPEMIAQARQGFPQLSFETADATSFRIAEPFDAVFSNAVLHWVKPPEDAVRSIAAALKPGGRFVAEFGGRGNVAKIVAAINTAVAAALKLDAVDVNPWYYPSVGEYATLLEVAGLEVRYGVLFDRPTPLDEGEQGLINWLRMFAAPCFAAIEEADRERVLQNAMEQARPALWNGAQWIADYRRLRIFAVKTE